jgi:surface protein
MPRIASTTSRGLTVSRPRSIRPLFFYYPLRNTATDPTSSNWKDNFAPAGYNFVPNDGIYTDSPITFASGMFNGNSTFNDPDISLWNVNTITNMSFMFANCTSFNQPIGTWDVSNVAGTGFAAMFVGATSFNQPIGSWDVSKATNMQEMFVGATSFNQPIGSWDVSNVTAMELMFLNATNFNQNLSKWDVRNITSEPMEFSNGSALDSLFKPKWGTEGVNYYPLRSSATDPTSTNWRNNRAPSGWSFVANEGIYTPKNSPITSMESMFEFRNTFNDVDITLWDTSSVTSLRYMFWFASSFNRNISTWNTSSVIDMFEVFSSASSFNQPVGNWNTSNVTNMSGVFRSATNFNQNVSSWDTSNVTDMSNMFQGVVNFNFNISNWDTSKVTNMGQMFSGATAFNQPIGSWDTGKVTSMFNMFNSASNFNQPIGSWDTSNVTTLTGMFSNATSFNQPLNNWTTFNVTQFVETFNNASSFNQPLNGWATDNAQSMNGMFNGASSFNQDLSGWCVSNIVTVPFNFSNGANNWALPKPIWGICPGPNQMILRVSVNEAGLSSGNYLNIGKGANVEVDWGDGTVETVVTPNESFIPLTTHQYAATGPYTVTITGSLPQYGRDFAIGIGTGFGQDFVTEVVQWNSNTTNFSWAFEDEDQLTSVPNTLPAGVTTMRGMFRGCTSLSADDLLYKGILDTDYTSNGFYDIFNNGEIYLSLEVISPSFSSTLSSLGNDVKIIVHTNNGVVSGTITNVTGSTGSIGIYFIRDQFGAAINLGSGQDQILSVSFVSTTTAAFNNWDVSAVTDMYQMFYDCNGAEFNPYLGDWDTGNVTSMETMFSGCTSFEGLGLERWDTRSVSTTEYMFSSATNFNAGIGTWDVSSVTNMQYMFAGFMNKFNQPIGAWDVSAVTNMDSMFYEASEFNQKIGGWDVSNVTNMSQMFFGATSFAGNLTGWSVPNITSKPFLFSAPNAVDPIWGSTQTPFVATIVGQGAYIVAATPQSFMPAALDIRIDWGDGNVTASTDLTGFYNHTYASFDTYTMTVSGCWEAASAIGGIPIGVGDSSMTSVSSFNSTMIRASFLFENRIGLTSVPATLPPSITDASYMFFGCINFNDPKVSLWDTSNITDMSYMFISAQALNQPLGSWDVSNVVSMVGMFNDATAFNQPLGSWDVSNVATMGSMFKLAQAFNQPLDSWDVSNVVNMTEMFSNSVAFNQDLSSWCVTNITSEPFDFAFNSALVPENFPVWGTCPSFDVFFIGPFPDGNIPEGLSRALYVNNSSTIPNGTTVYWTVSKPSQLSPNNGSFVFNSSDAFSNTILLSPIADFTTEGNETFTVSVRLNSITGTVIGTSAELTIVDRSIDTALLVHNLVDNTFQPTDAPWWSYDTTNTLFNLPTININRNTSGSHVPRRGLAYPLGTTVNNPWTLEYWIKDVHQTFGVSDNTYLFLDDTLNDNHNRFFSSIFSSGTHAFLLEKASSGYQFTGFTPNSFTDTAYVGGNITDWIHVAYVATSRLTLEVFINGVKRSTFDWTGRDPENIIGLDNMNFLRFGPRFDAGNLRAVFSDIRFSNIIRYTANFTPPSAPFIVDANTLVLLRAAPP